MIPGTTIEDLKKTRTSLLQQLEQCQVDCQELKKRKNRINKTLRKIKKDSREDCYDFSAQAYLVQTVSHWARQFIIEILNEQPATLATLTKELDSITSSLIYHLTRLRNAGIVKIVSKKGETIYHLDKDRYEKLIKIIELIR